MYCRDFLIALGSTDKEIFNYLKKTRKYKLSKDEWDALEMRGDGRTIMLNNGHIILRIAEFKAKSPNWYSVLTHEAFHSVVFVLQRAGFKLDESSDEAYAYLLGWLIREILVRV